MRGSKCKKDQMYSKSELVEKQNKTGGKFGIPQNFNM